VPEKPFILDAVAHAYHFGEDNYAHKEHAAAITQLAHGLIGAQEGDYALSWSAYCRNWSVEEMANLQFLETDTDVAVFHPTPINAYKDGLISVEKAAEARTRWPQRFLSYATVDPLAGEAALAELERQAELLTPIGVKLYPTSWRAGGYPESWRMDDPEVAFPIYEKARSLGIRAVGIHKSVPLGPVPMDPFKPGDVEMAAGMFPDLIFEIVHGGVAFTEETAWMIARFPNVYINMETLNVIIALNPRRFAEIMATLLGVGGEGVIGKFFWGTGTMALHPRPGLDAFREFQMPEDLLGAGGIFGEVPQITDEHKAMMLGLNYANAHGLDIEALRRGIADDEFEQKRREIGDTYPRPWSTTRAREFDGAPPEPHAPGIPAV
jgi:predicted TIM-barrel fold metal-dependent hydrolase